MELTLPLTKEIAKTLKVGDIIYLTGFVYTCRDAAHKKIEIALKHGEKPPVDLKNQIIYYAGPCPARPGLPIGSNGPTTAAPNGSLCRNDVSARRNRFSRKR